ncbi:MAG: YebC/PmpR family DNA-binding transcriptional regulator [Flavobacteriaceae bacterium]|nr:YebC/PmpR family DNA-binding transcriptional regulator [Flavobacteriaceae bacterium]
MGRAFEFRKSRKLKRWSTISKTFTKLSKEIIISVKESGSNLDNNHKLRAIIQNAKALNMPKENIERAIKKASDAHNENFKEIIFEGFAPFGIAIIIEAATNNNNRTVGNIRSYFNKFDGNLGVSGSVDYMFERSCNFKIKSNNIKIEELELEFIDYGVEEIYNNEDIIFVFAPFEKFGIIQKKIEEKSIKIISTEFERIPLNTKKLINEKKIKVLKLIEEIEKDDDVQNVYHNLEL